MGTLSLFAVPRDAVRAAFAGTHAATGRLLALARATWPPEEPEEHVGLLDRLGPFTARPVGGYVVRPDVPTRADVENVAHGRPPAPGRGRAARALLRAWASDAASDRLDLTVDAEAFDADAAAARAGGWVAAWHARGCEVLASYQP